MRFGWVLCCLIGCLYGTTSGAHGLAPLVLEVKQTNESTVDFSLKSTDATPKDIWPTFSPTCDQIGTVREVIDRKVIWRYWSGDCDLQQPEGLRVSVGNLDQRTMLVKTTYGNSDTEVALLSSEQPSYHFAANRQQSGLVTLVDSLKSGVSHLLVGVDHLLFILGLCLWLRERRALVFAVTAFTVGHSITLVLVSLDLLRLPIALAELVIAASIVVLALKVLKQRHSRTSPTFTDTGWLPFMFGLVHGTGFASALSESGLLGGNLILVVFGFNLGIELAQLACVLLILGAIHACARYPLKWRDRNQSAMSYGIGSLAIFWCLERIQVLVA